KPCPGEIPPPPRFRGPPPERRSSRVGAKGYRQKPPGKKRIDRGRAEPPKTSGPFEKKLPSFSRLPRASPAWETANAKKRPRPTIGERSLAKAAEGFPPPNWNPAVSPPSPPPKSKAGGKARRRPQRLPRKKDGEKKRPPSPVPRPRKKAPVAPPGDSPG